MVDHHPGRQQAHVADPVGDEGPQRRVDRRAAFMKEADQERRGDADALPAREQDIDAAGEDEQVHPEPEQRQQDEESDEADLAVEVAAREGVDE